jgi:serpin B
MRPIFRPLCALTIGLLAAQCRDVPLTVRRPLTSLPRELTGAESGIVSADNGFAFRLFGEIAHQASRDSNLFFSPLSTAMALGMAYNGAAGTTRTEMQQALQLQGLTLDDVNHAYLGLIALLRGLDPQVAFTLANSVWYRQDFTPTPAFLDATRTYFGATVQSLDFTSPSAAPTINRWVSDQTQAKIPTIVPNSIPRDVVAYLINAIYFKGNWTAQFDTNLTRPAPFTLANGATTSVAMMSHAHQVEVGFVADGDVTVVDLPYGEKAFSMTIVLPRSASGIDSVAAGLTQARWNAWMAGLDTQSWDVSVPKFTVTYQLTMNDALSALGMKSAFCGPWPTDFTRLDPSGRVCITEVKHKAFVDVNEEGTEAAAATSVGIGVTSVGPSLVVNHPFLFVIRERLSGTILFMGRVMNPAAT